MKSKNFSIRLFDVMIVVAVLAIVGLLLFYVCQPTMAAFKWQEETYIVEKGDSLWAISGEYCPAGVDRREWIAEVQEVNDLTDSLIHPGQWLTVLAPVEEE